METPTPEDMEDSIKNKKLPPNSFFEAYNNSLKQKDCPNCNAGHFNGIHCYDCGSDFMLTETLTKLKGIKHQ